MKQVAQWMIPFAAFAVKRTTSIKLYSFSLYNLQSVTIQQKNINNIKKKPLTIGSNAVRFEIEIRNRSELVETSVEESSSKSPSETF